MQIIKCALEDIGTLAVLNKQLIEDEQHDNSMSLDELCERMKSFIAREYEAVYFTDIGQILGYALIRKTASPYYLRQFFICREHRRKGLGSLFFKQLLLYLNTDTVDIEVLSWNKIGFSFWESLGFQSRSIYMRYKMEA